MTEDNLDVPILSGHLTPTGSILPLNLSPIRALERGVRLE